MGFRSPLANILELDYNTDFDVPNFENCMTTENYVDLVQYFTLYPYLNHELWSMDREVMNLVARFHITISLNSYCLVCAEPS